MRLAQWEEAASASARLRRVVLNEAERRLQEMAEALGQVPDFAGLHRLTQDKIGVIPGMGKLTIYDIAHRIGPSLEAPYPRLSTRRHRDRCEGSRLSRRHRRLRLAAAAGILTPVGR